MSALNDILSIDVSPGRLRAQVPAAWRGLANWWRSEFFGLLPQPLVAWLGGTAGPVIRIGIEADGVRVEGASAAGRVLHSGVMPWPDYAAAPLDRHLARIGLNRSGATIGIVLAPTTFFRRSFEIPVRARERVHAIARQELEHRMPFRADGVHLGMVIEPRRRNSDTLTVRQTIVRRDYVEEEARRLDLPLDDIDFVACVAGDSDSPMCSVPLRPEADREVPLARRLLQVLIAAAMITSGVDGALFWWKQERTIAVIEEEIAVVRKRALVVQSLEQEIVRTHSALRTLGKKRASFSTAELWRETSRVLPDHSWATEWRLQNGSVSVAGFSATATELVGLFEQSPLFVQANLNAPITFDATNGRERFSLVVHVHVHANPPSGRP